MSPVVGLGYLGFRAPDLDTWRVWATDVLGLQVATPPPDARAGHLYLRMDDRGWRFAVESSDSGGLAYTGWEVASEQSLRQVADVLAAGGVVVKDDPALARLRRVQGLIRCADPDGYALEFFYGAHVSEHPFVSPRGVRFVTGELGLGHILQTVRDLDATKHFYVDLLGFRMSDIIELGGDRRVHFTHVNRRHHSLAFVAIPDAEPALGHFMVEVEDIDTVGATLDLVHAGGAEVTETLGRHTNDLMLSFYMRNPSGSQTEYGYGGRLIDDAWTIATYTATATWGHKVPGSEYSATGPRSPRDGG